MVGTIAYCSREDAAPPLFAVCLARLCQRHPDAKVVAVVGNDIATQRNKAVLQAEGDWIWFIDTDQVFAAETLERLLAHNVPVVQTLCVMRHPPHEPLTYSQSATTRDDRPTGSPRLIPVQSLGAGGTLYRKMVFEQIPGPWFEGVIGQEDTTFAAKIVRAGLPLHVDLATPVGHLTPMAVWPEYRDGEWRVRYDAMNGKQVYLPAVASRIVRPELALSR